VPFWHQPVVPILWASVLMSTALRRRVALSPRRPESAVVDERVVLDKAQGVAADRGGVASRALLADVGVHRHHIRQEVLRGRWALHGRHTVAVHTRVLTQEELFWRAVWEVSASGAALDGVSALIGAGLRGFDEEAVHVSVVHNRRSAKAPGVRVHHLPRRCSDEVIGAGVPRVRPALAAIRAAHWAVSDRQAALILAMTVQQRLCSSAQLLAAVEVIRGRRRRALVKGVVLDVAGGAQSLGELDFAGMCRRHGLPEPDRQVIREDPTGRRYLDCRWRCGLVAEIDGAGHRWGLAVTDDNLRLNEGVVGGEQVLRFDTLGLRLREGPFMTQLRAGLHALGEPGVEAPSG